MPRSRPRQPRSRVSDNLQHYTEWMKGLFTPVPDGRAEIRSLAVDDARSKVVIYGIFRGTHTGEGGPVAPTGKTWQRIPSTTFPSTTARSATSRRSGTTEHRCNSLDGSDETTNDAPVVDLDLQRLIGSEPTSRR